jgi:DNA/RNA endonuclease YhcR with UshA esterase domain
MATSFLNHFKFRWIAFFLVSSVATAIANESSHLKEIDAGDQQSLQAQLGHSAAVMGVVVSVGRTSSDKIRFLDLTTNSATGFVAAVFPVVYPQLADLDKWIGKKVLITGRIEKYKSKTQIKIFNAAQIQILDPHDGLKISQ